MEQLQLNFLINLFIFTRCSDRILCREDTIELDSIRRYDVVHFFAFGRRYIIRTLLQLQHLASVCRLRHIRCNLPHHGYCCKVNTM